MMILISISKIYNDETVNEKYRNHISELDQLKSELSSQLLLTREDRQEKTEFFIKYSNYYNRLITKSPNLSIKQIDYSKSIYLSHLLFCGITIEAATLCKLGIKYFIKNLLSIYLAAFISLASFINLYTHLFAYIRFTGIPS
jgi:hypothetical protein